MTVAQIKDQSVSPRRLNAALVSSFGILAVIIAAVGIAGVLAFSVSARTNEIGIRMSLGADSGRVQRMILREGGVLLAIGLVLGVAGAFFAARVIRGLLFGVAPHDPATFIGVAVHDGGDRDRRVLDSGASRGADRPGDHHARLVADQSVPRTERSPERTRGNARGIFCRGREHPTRLRDRRSLVVSPPWMTLSSLNPPSCGFLDAHVDFDRSRSTC